MTENKSIEPLISTDEIKKRIHRINEKEVKSYYCETEINKWLPWIKKNWFLLVVSLVSIVFNFIQYFKRHELDTVLNKIFIDKHDKFEWAGVTAIVAMVTLISTIVLTIRKNRSDLVSKARIKWLDNVKVLTSSYLADINLVLNLVQRSISLKQEPKEIKKQIDETRSRLIINANQLLLNYSDNEDNKKIIECIEDCMNYTQDLIMLRGVDEFPEIKGVVIKNLRINSRDYFKREWKQVKKGK